jgi:DNA-binding GntR family transcriptional regulator
MARRMPAERDAIGRPLKGGSSDHAYKMLKRDIVSFALPPGGDLDEAALVARLGVSRTPVREALVRLAAEGLVQLTRNRGARVAPMSWDDIREHLEAFDVGQRLVTRWAATRRSDQDLKALEIERVAFERGLADDDAEAMLEANWRFHAAIAAACRNGVIEKFYLQLLTQNLRIARLAMTYECFPAEAAYRAHVAEIAREHGEIYRAIQERNAAMAEELAHSHADLARKRVAETLTQSPPAAMAIQFEAPAELALVPERRERSSSGRAVSARR